MPRIDDRFQPNSVDLPNLKSPKPASVTERPPQESTAIDEGTIARLVQYQQQTESQLADGVQAAHQAVVNSVERLERSAENAAIQLAHRQAIAIAAFPAKVNHYTAELLGQYQSLQNQAQQGFESMEDLNGWLESWTTAIFAPGAALLGDRPEALPEAGE